MHQVRESRRTDARSALLDLAGREERYYATNNAYTTSSADLGYTTTAQGSSWPQTIGSGYYQISQPTVPAAAIAAPSYSITATPLSSQVADTICASFTVTSTGQQTAHDTSNNDQSATCWGQ
jgi:type IV pilus assembly protein PilE